NWAAVSRAIARHDGVIANVGPGGAFHEADDPTASITEAMAGGAKPASAPVAKKPTPKPVAPVAEQPHERLIPEDEMPAANQEPYEAPVPENPPAPWFTQP